MLDVKKYLWMLGLTSKESDIFLKLFAMGTQPASVIARHISAERTSTYKMMLNMTKKWYLSKTKKKGISYFFANSIDVIKEQIKKQKEKTDYLDSNFKDFNDELQSLQSSKFSFAPKMTLYDGEDGIQNICNDIVQTITQHDYRIIKMFSSNTYDSYAFTNKRLKRYYDFVFEILKKKWVKIETRIGEWIELMENISTWIKLEEILWLPAWNNTINVFVIWETVYAIVFEDYPSGIKLKSKAFANMMHFLLEKLDK